MRGQGGDPFYQVDVDGEAGHFTRLPFGSKLSPYACEILPALLSTADAQDALQQLVTRHCLVHRTQLFNAEAYLKAFDRSPQMLRRKTYECFVTAFLLDEEEQSPLDRHLATVLRKRGCKANTASVVNLHANFCLLKPLFPPHCIQVQFSLTSNALPFRHRRSVYTHVPDLTCPICCKRRSEESSLHFASECMIMRRARRQLLQWAGAAALPDGRQAQRNRVYLTIPADPSGLEAAVYLAANYAGWCQRSFFKLRTLDRSAAKIARITDHAAAVLLRINRPEWNLVPPAQLRTGGTTTGSAPSHAQGAQYRLLPHGGTPLSFPT